MMPLYVKLFNVALDSGNIPTAWTIGVIRPIYKKRKNSPADPDNYKAITIVSNLGKLFTSLLNKRLNKYADNIELITKVKAGFRKWYSTLDNIFILHSLISIYLSSGKKIALHIY
jgi:hypothetical protein